jgi:hypothetical protein
LYEGSSGGRLIHPNIKFTTETESNNKIHYLDITIHRTPTNWVTSIYRKPTFTDTIIPYSSNHPTQHKYAAIRFLYNRLNTYNLHKEEYKGEIDTIHNIMLNNSFPVHTHTNLPPTDHPPTDPPPPLQMDKPALPHINGPPLHTLAKRPNSLQTYSKRQT